MPNSPQLPFTADSVHLQHFLSSHSLTTVSRPSKTPQTHIPLLETIEQESIEWQTKFKGTHLSHSCPSFRKTSSTRSHLPTKLYVLSRLMNGTDEASTCARSALFRRAPLTPTQQETFNAAIERVGDRQHDTTLQWFHVHISEQMLALGDNEIMLLLDDIDDERVRYALKLWRHFPDLFDYFVPLNVQHSYENQLHCSMVYRWQWKKRTYELEVFTPTQCIESKLLHHICYRITMMSLLDANKCTHLRLKWFPSKCTKRIGVHSDDACCKKSQPTATTNAQVWNPYQINTGATYRNTCNSVTIWRREEAGKTFLHEMMHGYGWDFEAPTNAQEWVRDHFAVHPSIEIRFYESYVETWATILNVYMTVMYHRCKNHKRHSSSSVQLGSRRKKRNNKIKKMRTKQKTTVCTMKSKSALATVCTLLQLEQAFVMLQVAKILVHSGFERWQDFFTDHKNRHRKTPNVPLESHLFQQKTSVFSYFIVRSAHMWNIKWFAHRFCTPDFNRHRTDELFGEWLSHLLLIFRSTAYTNTINTWMRWIRNQPQKSFVLDNMRMTCVEAV